jgi:hypothetical protein
MDPYILLATLAAEIGLASYGIRCWLRDGRRMVMGFVEALGRNQLEK